MNVWVNRWFIGAAGVTCFLALAPMATATSTIENFDSDPGWTGSNNTGFGNNNYGFSNTNNAGGAAGEAGGAVSSRTTQTTFYADTSIGTLSQQQSLSATGRLTNVGGTSGFDGGFEIGWFDSTSPVIGGPGPAIGGIVDAVTMRLIDDLPNTSIYRVQARWGEHGSSFITLTANTDYLFTLTYDPNGGGANIGNLDLTINLASDNSFHDSRNVSGASNGVPFAMDAFGFVTLDFGQSQPAANFFIDDLNYTTAIPEPSSSVLTCLAVFGLLATWRRGRS